MRGSSDLCQHRLCGRILQCDQPLAGQAAGPGGIGRGGDLRRGQSFEFGLALDQQRGVARGLQDILAELRGQRGQLLVELAQLGFVRLGQLSAGAHELGVIALEQLQRLGIQVQLRALAVERIDAGEQGRIEVDGIVMRAQQRRHLGLDLQHLLVAVGAVEVEEHGGDAIEQPAGALERDHRVGQSRHLRVVRNSVDLQALRRHARDKGRPVVRIANTIERRQLVGQAARLRKWVIWAHRGGIGGGRGYGIGCRDERCDHKTGAGQPPGA